MQNRLEGRWTGVKAEVGGCCRDLINKWNLGCGTEARKKFRGSKLWPAGQRNEVKGRTKGSLRKCGFTVLPQKKRNHRQRVTIIFIERKRYSSTKLTQEVQLITWMFWITKVNIPLMILAQDILYRCYYGTLSDSCPGGYLPQFYPDAQ